MQLIINSPGAYLRVKEGCFFIRTEEKEFQVSVGKVQSIVIGTRALVSTDALKLAVQHNIDVVFLDEFGNPYGRVWHCRMGSTAAIRRRQLEAAQTEEGLGLACEWVGTRLQNEVDFVEKLLRARPGKTEEMESQLSTLRQMVGRIQSMSGDLEAKRGELMGVEGTSGRLYFGALAQLIPERWRFDGRSRNPGKDPFNCMLNYAYGVLYGLVERACILAGLDPYVGLLHTDNYGKRSLVFDLIEPYRYLADSTVFYLFSGRRVKQEYFDTIPGGLSLNKEGKAVLMGSFNELLEKAVRYRGRNIKHRDIIQFECHRLANRLLGKKADDFKITVQEV